MGFLCRLSYREKKVLVTYHALLGPLIVLFLIINEQISILVYALASCALGQHKPFPLSMIESGHPDKIKFLHFQNQEMSPGKCDLTEAMSS